MFGAIEAEEAATLPAAASGAATNGDATRLPFADATFDRIIASEVLEHIPDDDAAFAELARVLRPGGTLAVTVPAWLAERVCWALTDEYHAPFVEGGHVRIYTEAGLRRQLRGAGLQPGAAHHAHALHPPYWWLRCAVGVTNDDHPLVQAYHQVLLWDIAGRRPSRVTELLDRLANPVLGKSIVVYATKPEARGDEHGMLCLPRRPRRRDRRRAAPDRRRHRRVAAALGHGARGSPAATPTRGTTSRRPWRSPSAAAAPRPSGPTSGCVGLQRPDGAWHQYYLADRVEQDKLDANVCAYVAAGVWHHCLLHRRRRLRRDDVAGGRAGHRLRARPADAAGRDHLGPPRRRHAVVVRAAHRLVVDLPLAALRHRPRRAARPRAARLGAVRRPPRPTSIAPRARRLRARSTAGRWTGTTRCSAASIGGDAGRERLAARFDRFVDDGQGVRCVNDRPWITVAETCECALAHLAVGERAIAERLFAWSASTATTTAATGPAPCTPTRPASPAASARPTPRRRSILAADALAGGSPAARAVRRPRRRAPRLIGAAELTDNEPSRD